MDFLVFLIIFPAVIGIFMLFARGNKPINFLGHIGSWGVIIGSIATLVFNFTNKTQYFHIEMPIIDRCMFAVEFLIAAYIFYVSVKAKKFLITLLALAQFLVMAYFEFTCRYNITVANNLFLDRLSLIMTFVIGVVGSLISIYSIGYMRDFHRDHAKQLKDTRHLFFAVIFIFFSAMFGVVFSNDLMWLYFFWEVTTICSFLLIGYRKDDVSRNNAFRALLFNLIGGLAFVVGLVYLYYTSKTIELDNVLLLSKGAALIPVALLCFAGMTKSAQLPFSSWLLGAMVAPTPVSALLHSSTMVKAGVYLALRFAHVLEGTAVGYFVAIIGGLTFLITSFIAISQSDAKKILAYSTIANLGLIILCAGLGTYESLWAGILLIIFHAITKCLLFLCVGVVEHKLHTRNIEQMTGLILTMPKLSIMMQIGMAGMFLAPFGMLIGKWAVLRALVDYNPLLAIFIVYGSSATLFFWVKWMGTLITVVKEHDDIEKGISKTEWFPMTTLAVMTISICALFPAISRFYVEPHVIEVYGKTLTMSHGNIIIMLVMLAMVLLFPLSFFNYGKKVKVVDAYLGGANADSSIRFTNSLGGITNVQMQGYYLNNTFNEARLLNLGIILTIILIFVMFGAALI